MASKIESLIFCCDDYLLDIVRFISRAQLASAQLNLVCSRFNRVVAPFLHEYGQYRLNNLFLVGFQRGQICHNNGNEDDNNKKDNNTYIEASLAVFKDYNATNDKDPVENFNFNAVSFPPHFYELVDFGEVPPPKNIFGHVDIMVLVDTINHKTTTDSSSAVEMRNFLAATPFYSFIGHLLALPVVKDESCPKQCKPRICLLEIFDAMDSIIFGNNPAIVESFFVRIFRQHKTTLSMRIYAHDIPGFPFMATKFRRVLIATQIFLSQFLHFSNFDHVELHMIGWVVGREDIDAMKALAGGLIKWLLYSTADDAVVGTSSNCATTSSAITAAVDTDNTAGRKLSLLFNKDTVTQECMDVMKVDFVDALFQQFMADDQSRTFTVHCSGINFQMEKSMENLSVGDMLQFHRDDEMPQHFSYEFCRHPLTVAADNNDSSKIVDDDEFAVTTDESMDFDHARTTMMCFMPYF